jgi:hypothetical protein
MSLEVTNDKNKYMILSCGQHVGQNDNRER